jgi:hypothetical protein
MPALRSQHARVQYCSSSVAAVAVAVAVVPIILTVVSIPPVGPAFVAVGTLQCCGLLFSRGRRVALQLQLVQQNNLLSQALFCLTHVSICLCFSHNDFALGKSRYILSVTIRLHHPLLLYIRSSKPVWVLTIASEVLNTVPVCHAMSQFSHALCSLGTCTSHDSHTQRGSQMRCLQVLIGLLLSCVVNAKLPICNLKFEISSFQDVRRLISGICMTTQPSSLRTLQDATFRATACTVITCRVYVVLH